MDNETVQVVLSFQSGTENTTAFRFSFFFTGNICYIAAAPGSPHCFHESPHFHSLLSDWVALFRPPFHPQITAELIGISSGSIIKAFFATGFLSYQPSERGIVP
jgi:hypothetical protein